MTSRQTEINPEDITLPDRLKEKSFLTFKEFGDLVGVSDKTVRYWADKGYVLARRFSPRKRMIHVSELAAYKEGRMMEKRGEA